MSKETSGMGIYTFAYPFSNNTDGANLVSLMQEVCKSNGLVGNYPKMGPHATILPPFFATKEEVTRCAMLSRFVWKIFGRPINVDVGNLGIFKSPDPNNAEETLYISLKIDDKLREFVERHKVDSTFNYKYPTAQTNPVDRPWIPHISLIEGKGILEMATPLLPRISQYMQNKTVELTEPLFFEKKEQCGSSYWYQVLV